MTWYGGWVNHLRLAADVWTDGYDSYTPSINVYIRWYVQCDSTWNFNDNQALVMTAPQTNTWNFTNNLQQNQQYSFDWALYGQGQSYSGGPTYTFAARVDGVYLGAGPSLSFTWSLPPRPIRPPGPPSSNPVVSFITGTTAWVSWGGTTDPDGATPDYDELQVATDTNFYSLVYDTAQTGSARTATNLVPDTTYYARARIHNAAGWSTWSGTGSFSTVQYQMAAPTVTAGVDTATLLWAAPSSSPAPSGYQIQTADDDDFTVNVQTLTRAYWVTTEMLTGLSPSHAYRVRMRAYTPGGYGVWSPTALIETLSAVRIKIGGTWTNCLAYVRKDAAWQQSTIHKRANGAWQG